MKSASSISSSTPLCDNLSKLEKEKTQMSQNSLQSKRHNPLDPPKTNEKKKKMNPKLKLLIRFFITQFGLAFIVLFFLVCGALLFQVLEQHASIQKCQEAEGKEKRHVEELARYIYNYVKLNESKFILEDYAEIEIRNGSEAVQQAIDGREEFFESYDIDISRKLLEYRDLIMKNNEKAKYWGQDCIKDSYWILESSLLFTLTILSTIGYGHVSPITWEGQIVCICFSMIGIPLFLMAIANISGTLSHLIKFLYSSFIGCLCGLKEKDQNEEEGDKSKTKTSSFGTLLKNDQEVINTLNTKKGKSEIDDDDNDDANGDEEDMDKYGIMVPLLIIILIMILYITIGMLIYERLEGWAYTKSLYFTFITVATIGFGDLVPGISYLYKATDQDKEIARRNLIVTGMYIIIGMAILVICFDLIQGKLAAQFALLRNLKRFLKMRNVPAKSILDEKNVKNRQVYIENEGKEEIKYRKNELNNDSNNDIQKTNIIYVNSRENSSNDNKNQSPHSNQSEKSRTVTSGLTLKDINYQ